MQNWFIHNERRIREYAGLQGQRCRIKTKSAPDLSEVMWFLGQEHDCVMFAQEPRQANTSRRHLSFLNSAEIEQVEILDHGPESADLNELNNARFVHARIAVQFLNTSGSRVAVEVTGTEPRFGGVFSSPNHALGSTILHLHEDLRVSGLIASQDVLPLNPRYKEVPPTRFTELTDPAERPAATLLILSADFGRNAMAGLTFPELHTESPGGAIKTKDHILVSGYIALCQFAATCKILPSNYKPQIRRGRLK